MAINASVIAIVLIIGVVLLFFIFASPCKKSGFQSTGGMNMNMNMTATQASASNMQKLWSEHVFWTRLFIISSLYNLPTLPTDTQRLLRNQADIGQTLGQTYGSQFGVAAQALLEEHIHLAAQIVAAAKAKQPLDQLIAKWKTNAEQISAALNSVNPQKFPLDQTNSMMQEHLTLTSNELTDLLNSNYSAAVQDMDMIHTQAVNMALMMA